VTALSAGAHGLTSAPDGGRVLRVVVRRRWRVVMPVAVACGDLVAATLAVAIAASRGYGGDEPGLQVGGTTVGWGAVAVAIAPLWIVVLAAHGTYQSAIVATGAEELRRVLRGGLTFFGAVAVGHLVLDTDLSGGAALVMVLCVVAFTLGLRVVAERLAHHARRRQRWVRRAVLYGDPVQMRTLRRRLVDDTATGVEVVGACDRDAPDDVLRMVSSTGADVLAVMGDTSGERLRALAWSLEDTGVDVLVAPVAADGGGHRLAPRSVAGRLWLRVDVCRLKRGRLVAKNALDRCGAAIGLLVLAPVLLAVALAVKATSRGPVLYHQARVGQYGRPFSFVKFRTMVVGADRRDRDLVAHSTADGLLFKIPHDPRVTRMGRFLRRTSLDELPQLWNVLRGSMSLVGPRPLPVDPDDFVGDARRRLRVKPGITGLWQVAGRSELSWEETVRLDLRYVDHWSLGLDLAILLRTPWAVVRGRGAY
jgi:exopolysaccharide biosynthesis polyprenyl glycosylphosphotransferase